MTDFKIRPYEKADLELLPDMENRADQIYGSLPRFAPMLEMEGLTLEQGHDLPTSTQIWVAETDGPVGFVFTRDIDDLTYFGQLSVVPEAQNRGIGSALLKVAVEAAKNDNKRGLALITYADIPWNAPYYAKHGFRALERHEMGAELLALAQEDEKEWALFSPRLVMGRFFS